MRISLLDVRWTTRSAAVTASVVLSACIERPPELHYGMIDPSPVWTMRLEGGTNEGPTAHVRDRTVIRGEALMLSGPRAGETMVQLAIVNMIPGGRYIWHVHHGDCQSVGNIAGPSSEYPPLVASASGKAGVRALLPFTVPTTGQFHIDIHASPASVETIACGELRRHSHQ